MMAMLSGYKTLIGAGIAFLAELLRLFDIDIGDQDFLVNAALTIGGLCMAIYGRITATRNLRMKEPLQ